MSRTFSTCVIPDAISGDYEVITDYPSATYFAGKNLYHKTVNPRKGDNDYHGLMHEKFNLDAQYQTMLDAIDGDVLYLGMGIALFAESLKDDVAITLQDCVELRSDVVTLCGSVFDTVFTADAFSYTPIQNYDTIVIDCFDNMTESYPDEIAELQDRFDDYLNVGGQILTYNIG